MESDYKIIRELGKGAFGTVYLIKHKTENEVFALKAVDLGRASSEERKSAEKEAQVMSELDHCHVVRYIASYFEGRTLFIFTEYCEGGDMAHFLEDSIGSLPEALIVCWVSQTVSALEYLHAKNILHRDLKPQNIYLSGEADIKLGDLGIARVLDQGSDLASTMAGTPCYMSPEIFQAKGYNHKTDIWSFGCVVYELAAGERAFDAPIIQFLIFKIIAGTIPPISGSYSADLKGLVKSMMAKDPDERPSASQLLKRSPVKEFLANPQRPKEIMAQSKFRTKWGTQESSVDIFKMLINALVSTPPPFKESDIRIPKDSLKVYRERMKRQGQTGRDQVPQFHPPPAAAAIPKAADIYTTIKAPKGNKAKAKVGQKNMDVTIKGDNPALEGLSEGRAAIERTLKTLVTESEGSEVSSTKKAVEAQFLMRQIEVLQRHCARGLGEDTLRHAYAILDSVQNPVQLKKQLVELVGDDKFKEFGDKIMYLRLFEVGLNKVQSKAGK